MTKPDFDPAMQAAFDAARAAIGKITDYKTVPRIEPSAEGDKKADEEASAIASGHYDDIEKQRQKAETQTIVETNRDLKVNRRLRWRYATWVFKYLVFYSVVVGGFIFLDAIGAFHFPYWFTKEIGPDNSSTFHVYWTSLLFDIPDNTLTALVGSTAISAIGLVLAVTHGLFGKK